jgi:thioredoxin 1
LDLLIYAALGLSLTWAAYAAYMHIATRAAEGRPAEPLLRLFPGLADHPGRALVYCYSPQCGPCRPMSQEVDRLVAGGARIYKLDVSEQPELAREIGIRATPTLVMVEGRTVSRLLLGAKRADFMQRLLTGDAAD